MRYKFCLDKKGPQVFVYAWYRGLDCLYVGATICGGKRFSSHTVVRDVESTDTLLIWYPNNSLSLLLLEAGFIRIFKPKFNKTKPNSYINPTNFTPSLVLKPVPCREPYRHF